MAGMSTQLRNRINEERAKADLPPINCKGQIKKPLGRPRIDPELLKKPMNRKSFLNFYPDEPKKEITRPPAVYNNTSYTSVYEKYGV
jgi:hypothetical protein